MFLNGLNAASFTNDGLSPNEQFSINHARYLYECRKTRFRCLPCREVQSLLLQTLSYHECITADRYSIQKGLKLRKLDFSMLLRSAGNKIKFTHYDLTGIKFSVYCAVIETSHTNPSL